MPIKKIIIKLFPRIYIKKNFSDLGHATFSNYHQKNIEPELLLLPYLLKKNEGFVDVGSNKGSFLFSASGFLQPGSIFAFEPNPVLFNKIKSVFKKVNIFNIALSDKSGEAVLTVPFTGDQPDDSLANINSSEISANAFNFKVKVKKLDDCLSDLRDPVIALIKIDVEGHELDVLKGAHKTIEKYLPTLIVEIEQRHHTEKVEGIIDGLSKKYGYSVYYFFPARDQLISFVAEPVIHQDLNHLGTNNYVNNFIFISNKNDPDALIKHINSEIANAKKK